MRTVKRALAMKRKQLIAFLLAVCALAFACDEAWYYIAPGARFLKEPQPGTRIALRVSSFAFDITVDMVITNDGCDALQITPALIKLIDKAGNEILPKPIVEYDCDEYRGQKRVSLAKSESCSLIVLFDPHESVESPVLEELTLVHEGVLRNGQVVPISILLKKQNYE